MTVAPVSTSLEDVVALSLYESLYAALTGDQRDAAQEVVERLRDWFENNWREWLELEDGSMPWDEPPGLDEAYGEGVEAVLAELRVVYRTASPVERGTIASLAERVKKIGEKGRP